MAILPVLCDVLLTFCIQPVDLPSYTLQVDGISPGELPPRPQTPSTRPLPDPILGLLYFALYCVPNIACYIRLLILIHIRAPISHIEALFWLVIQNLSLTIPAGMRLEEQLKTSYQDWSPRLRAYVKTFQLTGLALSIFVPLSLLWWLIYGSLERFKRY